MMSPVVRLVLAQLSIAATLTQAQAPRRLEVGALLGASEVNARSRYPGESDRQAYFGARADARLLRLGPGTLGVAAFWDRYRYDEVASSISCDRCIVPDLGGPFVPPNGFLTGRDQFASRLGGGLTWQWPLHGRLFADVGALAGRFSRAGSPGDGFKALTDASTSRSFLGLEAGLTAYWHELGFGGGYEYNQAWRVHGTKPTAHRLRLRAAYALPLGAPSATRRSGS